MLLNLNFLFDPENGTIVRASRRPSRFRCADKILKEIDTALAHWLGIFWSSQAVPGHNASCMDKRYQVFVSSTYVDLKEERKAVIQAVVERTAFPLGWSFFVPPVKSSFPL